MICNIINNVRIYKYPFINGNSALLYIKPLVFQNTYCYYPIWGIVLYKRLGFSDEEILELNPELTESDLLASWEYYSINFTEINDCIRKYDTGRINYDSCCAVISVLSPEEIETASVKPSKAVFWILTANVLAIFCYFLLP